MTQRNHFPARGTAGIAILAVALGLGGCAVVARQDRQALVQAGFKPVPADTVLNTEALPAHEFTHRSINGVDTVVYSDPAGCRCVYAGTEHDYQKYFDELESERAHSGGP
jgi:hypothetical protein